ncbi:YdeI/OmpD-associated family protein [Bdellovibrio sp. HCB288]|uniref:YdeI/OmpD-associated family protein n=1 Tax=Bdellovibrio sp. HCB288 TaxID=3394355 RepID=UPI0039B67886
MAAKTEKAKVDSYIKSLKKWQDEVSQIRALVLESGLIEEFKWRLPCYTNAGNNIAIIQNFKDSCALMFFKGVLLKDPKKLLKAPGQNSQTARRLEFTSSAEVKKMKTATKTFIKQAIRIEETGAKVTRKPADPVEMPAEFKQALTKDSKLKKAFQSLTPGRQRLYLMHFASAKQPATRIARIEKYTPNILKGLGMNDR